MQSGGDNTVLGSLNRSSDAYRQLFNVILAQYGFAIEYTGDIDGGIPNVAEPGEVRIRVSPGDEEDHIRKLFTHRDDRYLARHAWSREVDVVLFPREFSPFVQDLLERTAKSIDQRLKFWETRESSISYRDSINDALRKYNHRPLRYIEDNPDSIPNVPEPGEVIGWSGILRYFTSEESEMLVEARLQVQLDLLKRSRGNSNPS